MLTFHKINLCEDANFFVWNADSLLICPMVDLESLSHILQNNSTHTNALLY